MRANAQIQACLGGGVKDEKTTAERCGAGGAGGAGTAKIAPDTIVLRRLALFISDDEPRVVLPSTICHYDRAGEVAGIPSH